MTRIILIFSIFFSINVEANRLPSTNFKSVQEFINRMVKEHNFSRKELVTIFSQVSLRVPAIKDTTKEIKKQKKVTKKKKPMPWNQYRELFVNTERIDNGVEFWKKYHKNINEAENKYSVPAEIIVAILGIETNYGKTKGKHPTFESLTVRAFGNYRRSKFYKDELESFLLMVRENVLPPLAIKGSYAGAMGYPQFISSSYRNYAIDFNGDGKVDLFSNPIDSIGSIANYIAKHYWVKNGDIAKQTEIDNENKDLAKSYINKPTITAKLWKEKGIDISPTIKDDTKVSFILLKHEETIKDERWLTFWNFYVLTRYNHDNRYAMAAFQLAEKLKQRFK